MRPMMDVVRVGDIAIGVVAVAIVVAISVWAVDRSGPGAAVEITTDGGILIYPLDEPRIIEVSGPLGPSTIEIDGGGAFFATAPCRDQLCVIAGHQHEAGQWAACLPNRVFLTIIGDTDAAEIDALSF